MSGRLGLPTPWTRGAVRAEERAAIEAEIPDGELVMVIAKSARGPFAVHGSGIWRRTVGDAVRAWLERRAAA